MNSTSSFLLYHNNMSTAPSYWKLWFILFLLWQGFGISAGDVKVEWWGDRIPFQRKGRQWVCEIGQTKWTKETWTRDFGISKAGDTWISNVVGEDHNMVLDHCNSSSHISKVGIALSCKEGIYKSFCFLKITTSTYQLPWYFSAKR